MNWLTLSEIKAQCRIDEDDTLEDEILTAYGDAAEQMICGLCLRDEYEMMDRYGLDLEGAKPLRVAMLMVAAQLYKYREVSTPDQVNEVPADLMALVRPFVKLAEV